MGRHLQLPRRPCSWPFPSMPRPEKGPAVRPPGERGLAGSRASVELRDSKNAIPSMNLSRSKIRA